MPKQKSKIAGVEISNPEKIIYPKSKINKKDIIDYYDKASSLMLPFLKDRFLAFERYPNGINKEGFYQKNAADYFPNWIKSQKYKSTDYVYINDKKSLLYMANQASISLHSWLSKRDKPDYPDKIIWDLDPPKDKPVNMNDMVQAASALKKILEHLGLKPYIMSTGSKGFHIVSPIKRNCTFTASRKLASRVAEIIVAVNPDKYTTEQRIEKRQGRIFLDVIRNTRAQLAITPYSLRPIEPASIAIPLDWKDLNPKFKHADNNIKTIDKHLKKQPWKNFFAHATDIKDKSINEKLSQLEKEI